MARRKKLNWGAFGSEALMGFGEGMQGWGQMTQERERYQTSEAGRMLDRLADQHTRTRGREEDVPAILKSVEEQYPHAKSEAWDSIMKAATLTPGERQDIFAESLRELGPDASQEQLEQIYTSANFKEPWQAHPERTMAPDQYGPPIEGYAPGGDVSKAQGMLSGLQEQAGRGEERAIDVAARTARVTQQPQKISIVHTGDDGEEFPAILMLRQSPDGGRIHRRDCNDRWQSSQGIPATIPNRRNAEVDGCRWL